MKSWLKTVHINQVGHLRAAAYYTQLSRTIGLIVVVLSAVTSASAFSSLNSSNNQVVLAAVGIISLIATLFSSVQAFLNYPDLASKHQTAGLNYSKLRRWVEETLVCTTVALELKDKMDEIRRQIDKLDAESPVLTQSFFNQGLKIVDSELAKLRGVK